MKESKITINKIDNGDEVTNVTTPSEVKGFSKTLQIIRTSYGGVCVTNSGNETTESLKGEYYISYVNNETAICIPGSDTIPVAMLVLDGDHREELLKIVNSERFHLGECLRYVVHHQEQLKNAWIAAGLFKALKIK